MKWFRKLFCFHSRLNSTEVNDYGMGGEEKIIYSSPWSLFGTKLKHYRCGKCSGTYWETPYDHNWLAMNEKFIKSLKQ